MLPLTENGSQNPYSYNICRVFMEGIFFRPFLHIFSCISCVYAPQGNAMLPLLCCEILVTLLWYIRRFWKFSLNTNLLKF